MIYSLEPDSILVSRSRMSIKTSHTITNVDNAPAHGVLPYMVMSMQIHILHQYIQV